VYILFSLIAEDLNQQKSTKTIITCSM